MNGAELIFTTLTETAEGIDENKKVSVKSGCIATNKAKVKLELERWK
jgi:hypothetical protein